MKDEDIKKIVKLFADGDNEVGIWGHDTQLFESWEEAIRETKEEIFGILKEILKSVEEKNPYPVDVFREPTKKEWKIFHKILKENGFSSEKFVGSCCRLGFKTCLEIFKKEIGEVR